MPVRRGTAHRLCREIATCAAAIFHHNGISETLAELLPDKAGDNVGDTAGGECDLECDGLRRIGLGRCGPRATGDGIFPVDDGLMKARPRFATAVPVGEAMSPFDHADDV